MIILLQASKSDKNTSKLLFILICILTMLLSDINTTVGNSVSSFFICQSEQKMPEGSWKCEKCNNINYPFRTKCNRQNCGADKPAESEKSPSSSPDQNEQVCPVKPFQFANLHALLQQRFVLHEQLCDSEYFQIESCCEVFV